MLVWLLAALLVAVGVYFLIFIAWAATILYNGYQDAKKAIKEHIKRRRV